MLIKSSSLFLGWAFTGFVSSGRLKAFSTRGSRAKFRVCQANLLPSTAYCANQLHRVTVGVSRLGDFQLFSARKLFSCISIFRLRKYIHASFIYVTPTGTSGPALLFSASSSSFTSMGFVTLVCCRSWRLTVHGRPPFPSF